MTPASRKGTPIAHAIGANTQPKICCMLSPRKPSRWFTSATSARNEISIAPTFSAR